MKMTRHFVSLICIIAIIAFSCKKQSTTPSPSPTPPAPQTVNVTWQIALLDFNNGVFAPYSWSGNVTAQISTWGNGPSTPIGTYTLVTVNPPCPSVGLPTICNNGFTVNSVSATIQKGSSYLIQIFNGSTHVATFEGNDQLVNSVTYPITFTDTNTGAYLCYSCTASPFFIIAAR